MKVAILYICTGRYNQFFAGFYRSCEELFLHGEAEKTYFVWTDDTSLTDAGNVVLTEKQCEGFPHDSLFRFKMFLQRAKELERFDYIFFFNSNAQFLRPVTAAEFLPTAADGYLLGAEWPGKRKPFHHAMFFPFERNRQSRAYVAPWHSPYTYFMGGVNGGRSREYLSMICTLGQSIDDDYSRGIIARVHDESHINAYFRTHGCKILSAEYCIPEEWAAGMNARMVFRDKVRLDPYFDKGRDRSLTGVIKKTLLTLWNALRWYLCV